LPEASSQEPSLTGLWLFSKSLPNRFALCLSTFCKRNVNEWSNGFRRRANWTRLRLEAAILGVPSYAPSLSGHRLPNPAEASRQPVYAPRLMEETTRILTRGGAGACLQLRTQLLIAAIVIISAFAGAILVIVR